MKASTLILSMDQESNLFNGHLQTELNSIVKTQLIDLIEEIYEDEKNEKRKLFLSLYEENGDHFSLSLYQKDYWKKGENSVFTDRLILSVDRIDYEGDYKDFFNDFIYYIESKNYLKYELKLEND